MALLLGTHSKSRSRTSRSGLGYSFRRLVDNLLGRSSSGRSLRRDDRGGQKVSIWVLLIGVLIAFGGGFLLGGRIGGNGTSGPAGLNAVPRNDSVGRAPSVIGEVNTDPMAPQAFIVSVYPDMEPTKARSLATDLANYLKGQGFAKARPYPYPNAEGVLWVVAVYFDGEPEEARTRDMLQALPAQVPDQMFVRLRNTEAKWPKAWQIR